MKTLLVLLCCVLPALQHGNAGLSSAVEVYAGAEGGSGSLGCSFNSSGSTMFFCKGECKGEGILIKTEDTEAQSGRFSVKSSVSTTGRKTVTVKITNLKQSDTSWYTCGLGGPAAPTDSDDFHLTIMDEATLGSNNSFLRIKAEGESITVSCRAAVHEKGRFFCKGECTRDEDVLLQIEQTAAASNRYAIEYKAGKEFGLHVTIRDLRPSDTGQYQCGYGSALSPDSSYLFKIIVVQAPPTPEPTQMTASPVPSAPTPPPPTQRQHVTPSSAPPETTAAAATGTPDQTLSPFPAYVPPTATQSPAPAAEHSSAPAATQSPTPAAEHSSAPTPPPPEPTKQGTANFSSNLTALASALGVGGVLAAAASALLLHRWRKRKHAANGANMEVPVEKLGPVPPTSGGTKV